MVLVVVRHAESIENAGKYNGFYQVRRPYSGRAAHEISRNVIGLTPRGFRQAIWLGDTLADLNGPDLRVYSSTYRRAIDTAAVAFPRLLPAECRAIPGHLIGTGPPVDHDGPDCMQLGCQPGDEVFRLHAGSPDLARAEDLAALASAQAAAPGLG